MTTTAENKRAVRRQPPGWLWGLYAVDSLLLIASGLIHLHLWDIAYRHVATLDVLFPVQTAASVLLAFGLLAIRRQIVVAAGLLLMAGTIVGFILARSVGIFGFKLTFSSGLATTVLVVEIAALVALAVTAWVMRRLA
jgi:hypothetical protein